MFICIQVYSKTAEMSFRVTMKLIKVPQLLQVECVDNTHNDIGFCLSVELRTMKMLKKNNFICS